MVGESKKRGVRKRLIEIYTTLDENFLKVLQDHTAGDPMSAEVRMDELVSATDREADGVSWGTPSSVVTWFRSCFGSTGIASKRR